MRVAGIDYGDRWVGIATGDTVLGVATPSTTLKITGMRDAVAQLTAFIQKERIAAIVVGLPLHLNGTRGPAAEKAEGFAQRMRDALTIPVETWDERLTTTGVHRDLIEAGVRRDQRGKVVDQLAAQRILQTYLDAHADLQNL